MVALNMVGPAPAVAETQQDPSGNWFGTLVTDKGKCPDERESVLQVEPDRVAFTPETGTLVLHGKPDPDHHRFHAQLILMDMNHHPLPMVFEGHSEGDTIVGVYGTPTCRAHIVLKRAKSDAWKNFLGR